MNKLHKWIGIATALFFVAPVLQAQPNNFYRRLGNFDHGKGNEVIASIDPANPGFIVAGTARVAMPNNMPGVNVSAYNPGGGPIWSQIYPINNGMPAANTTADAVSIAAAPGANVYGVLAYTDFTAPAQSVLFEINLAGAFTGVQTELGDLRATSVIFDPAINCFVVLGQAPINGNDLQMIVVAVGGGIVFTGAYDSGPNYRDTPSRLMLDPFTGGYVLVGTSQNPGSGDNNVFVVRILPGFGLLCSETFGNPGVDEYGVDVTWGKNVFGNPVDIILANQRGGQIMPFVIEIDPFACPSFISSTLLDPFKTPNNIATGITTDPFTLNICISGLNRDVNTNGFVIVLNNGYAPITYTRYGQPWLPGDEDLTDIMFDVTANQIVCTGEHQLLNPWPGFPTPPGEFFEWLPMMNSLGGNMCPDMPPINAYPICPPDLVQNIQNPFFNFVPVNIFQFPIPTVFLNECFNPFRQAGDSDNPAAANEVSLFPNPANNTVSLTYNVSSTDQPVLEVTNMLGEVILTKSLSGSEKSAEVDVSELAPGMYMFRVRNGDVDIANEKVTIQR